MFGFIQTIKNRIAALEQDVKTLFAKVEAVPAAEEAKAKEFVAEVKINAGETDAS